MIINFCVDRIEAFKKGIATIDINSSIEVDPYTLSQEDRDLIAKHLGFKGDHSLWLIKDRVATKKETLVNPLILIDPILTIPQLLEILKAL